MNLCNDPRYCVYYCPLHDSDIFGLTGDLSTNLQQGTTNPMCLTCKNDFVNSSSTGADWRTSFSSSVLKLSHN